MALRPVPGCELKVLIATNTGAVPAENRFEDRGLTPLDRRRPRSAAEALT